MNENKKIQRLNVSTPKDIRRYIARLMKEAENGEIELNKARLLINSAETLLKAYRMDVLEERLNELSEITREEVLSSIEESSTEENDFLAYIKSKRDKKEKVV